MVSNGIQKQVNTQPSPAVAGDFCTTNPRFSVLAGQGALVAGTAGVTIGRFAWLSAVSIDNDNAPAIVNSFGTGPVGGFVHREQQGLITTYLAESGMTIAPGFQMTLMSGGDFWVQNDGTTQALPGQKAYADFADGKATFDVTDSPTSGASSDTASIAAGLSSFTGAIADNILTASAVTGAIVIGTIVAGAGVATGTQVLGQLTGSAGDAGTYVITPSEQTVAEEAMTGSYGTLTIGGTVTGTFGLGDIIAGAGVTDGTTITALGSGTGGAGTYIVNLTQTVGPIAVTAGSNVETKWICMSGGAPGELVKITDHPLG